MFLKVTWKLPFEKKRHLTKTLLVMKFIVIFLFAAGLQVSATGYSQTITLAQNNVSLKKVFREIEKQSGYQFFYKDRLIRQTENVSINVHNATVEKALNECFKNQPLSYTVLDKIIIVKAKKQIDLINPVAVLPAPVSLIRGTVKDDKGNPLTGVSVIVKGTTKGTSTATDGSFTIDAKVGDVLEFSMVGYQKRSVTVGNNQNINVVMEIEVTAGNEIVVVGYGTQSREKVIGSVAQISGDKIANRAVTQLKDALTGQLSGVTITQRSGRPGVSSGTISIRGVGSFGASPNPLILVDGIPVGSLNDINPSVVESISVLKDASSAAIYGSRAANGVILVTTKSGKLGLPQISLNSYVATQRPTVLPEYVNSWEYQQAYFEAENGSSQLTTDQKATVEKYKAQNDPDFPNTNFLDAVISKDGFQTGHDLNISGGTNTNKYNLSLGYLYQNGLVVQNDYSRYNVRLNMITNLSPKLSLMTRIAAIATNTNEPRPPTHAVSGDMLGIITQAVRLPNTFVGIYPNGDFGLGLASSGTPVSDLSSKSFYRNKGLGLSGNLRLDYKVIKDLKLSFISSYEQNNLHETLFRSTLKFAQNITLGPNTLTETTDENDGKTVEALANYTKQAGKHYYSILAGYSFETYEADGFDGYRDNFPSDDITVLNAGSPSNQQSGGTRSASALESQFGRVDYNYASKYLVEGVIRRDGSSRFPSTQKYAVFPSVAVGWRIGEEKFIKDNISWISELKLKASWGVLGNQDISNYPFQNTLVSSNANSGGTSYSFGGQIVQGATRTTLVDSTLHWESTRTKDLGIEVGLFKNKLNFSATYFDRYTYDILYSPATSVSNVLGFDLSQRNTGKLKNTGWEFIANYTDVVGKFSFNINTNFTIVKNRVIDLGVGDIIQPNGLVGNGSDLFIGYPNSNSSYDLYYGYVADGLYVDAQDVIDYGKNNNQDALNPNPKPGDIRYKDISGPNGVPDGVVNATYDRVVLGSQIPKYTYGINLGGHYAGFDLNILLQGITGVKGRLDGYASYALYNLTGNIQRWQYDGRWTDQNPDRNAIYPRIEQVSTSGVNTLLSSFWVLNGSYLRIKNIQLGYNIPPKILEKIKILNARIYASGENLVTFSHYEKGWDPEINGDGTFYPIMSTYTLGVNVTF